MAVRNLRFFSFAGNERYPISKLKRGKQIAFIHDPMHNERSGI